MESEWQRYHRNQADKRTFSLMMLDLDYFKGINDKYGHQVGDELLKQVSARILSEVRAYSDIGRYGGEEFIVLLPETNMNELVKVSDRVLRLVADTPYSVLGHEINVTVSIGIATSNQFDTRLDTVIKRADDNLYKAKAAGRNCVAGAA